MNNYEEVTCRICLQSKDPLFSLFHKVRGSSPIERLTNKTRIKINIDSGPSSICSQCLLELNATIKFLEKCEKSNEVLAAKCKDINSVDDDTKGAVVGHYEDEILSFYEVSKETPVESEAAKCQECGSLRRCKHWAPPITHTCHFCQKVFTRRFNFKLHLKRHLGEKEWPCPKCGVRVLTQWLAQRHCGPRPRRSCPKEGCFKSFTTNTNLNNHIRSAHYGEKPYACTVCEKTFTTKNTLDGHLRIHTGVKPYMCPVCGRQFATNKLAGHMRTHTGVRAHACPAPACSRAFASARALALHAPTHAPPVRRHVCARCPAAYAHKQSLRKHIRQRHPQPDAATNDVVI